MNFNARGCWCILVLLLLAVLPMSPDARAQEHVVSAGDLHRDIVAAAQARQSNQVKIQNFFSSDEAKRALKSAHLPYERVQRAVLSLGDEELARLAARTVKIESDFAAGSLSNQELTYIIIALGTAVIILVIVAARR